MKCWSPVQPITWRRTEQFNSKVKLRASVDESACETNPASVTLEIPVFPMRKSVRLPSDLFKLGLYEPRYLKMSKHILESPHRMFGAVYSSDKPQIIRGGSGPIVPIIKAGDIGVVCWVFDHEYDRVLRRNGNGFCDVFRLFSVAGCRFQVESVVSTGYNSDTDFLRVRASVENLATVGQEKDQSYHDSAAKLHVDNCNKFMSRYGLSGIIPDFAWIEARHKEVIKPGDKILDELSSGCFASNRISETSVTERRQWFL